MGPLLIVFLILAILGFAFYGLITFLSPSAPGETDAVRSTYRVLDQLFVENALTYQQFVDLRMKVRRAYPYVDPSHMSSAAMAKWRQERPANDPGTPKTDASLQKQIPSLAPDLDSELTPKLTSLTPVASEPVDTSKVSAGKSFDELPAAPSPARRSWSDLLSGFMQENNIRWGELASGILIVGSAVGLVVSLREELRETIPYFPALLFMFITAAVNGAGIYTLKRWNLHNTSRGVLVIGLLLVPLSFLAGCVLTDERRGINDPIYWLAVVVGLAGFSYITWHASKCLLRFRHVPLFASTMGSSVGLLIANRFEATSGSSWQTWSLGLIPLASFVVGTAFVVPQSHQREKWSLKSVNRLWICLGIGAFAFLTALSLVLIRSVEPTRTLIASSAIWGTAGAFAIWCGAVVFQGYTRKESQAPRIAGTAVGVFGLLLVVAANLAALPIPSILVATSICIGLALLWISANRRLVYGLPLGWGCLAIGSVAGLNLMLSDVQWDRWATPGQLFDLATNAKCGLWMLFFGIAILAVQRFLLSKYPNHELVHKADLWNRVSGGLIAGVGCLVALGASFVHPNDAFDNYTATAMLCVASAAGLWLNTRREDDRYSIAAVVTTLACLSHAFVWNQFLVERVNLLLGANCGVALVFVLAAALFAWNAVARSRRFGLSSVTHIGLVSAATGAAGLLGTAMLVPEQSGLASSFALIGLCSAALFAFAIRRAESSSWLFAVSAAVVSLLVAEVSLRTGLVEYLWSIRHIAIQLAVLSLWTAEWLGIVSLISRSARPQISALQQWMTRDNGQLANSFCITILVATVSFCCLGIIPEYAAELTANLDAGAFTFPMRTELWFVGAAVLCASVLAIAGTTFFPSWSLAYGLLSLWLVAWSLGGFQFAESRSFATANRWLLPMGGALAALAIGSRSYWITHWEALRCWLGGPSLLLTPNQNDEDSIGRLGVSPGSEVVSNSQPGLTPKRLILPERLWSAEVQQLINFGLLVVVGIVLALTTIAISRFLVFGKESLGGPVWPSFFGKLRKDVSYGGPIGIIVSTFLFYAITERRNWLAVAGSLVYQYVVLVAVVLLFISPHPKLASEWFLHVMQAVSGGMSAYGLVWYFFRDRIRTQPISQRLSWTQLDVHTAINCVLVVSLATLIIQRFFFHPAQPADWINEAGGKFGIGAFVAVVVLVLTIWWKRLAAYQFCIVGLVGLTACAFLASFVDRVIAPSTWWPFRTIAFGSIVVGVALVGLLYRRSETTEANHLRSKPLIFIPFLVCFGLALVFVAKGYEFDAWLHGSYMVSTGLVACGAVAYGFLTRSAWSAWFAAFANAFFVLQVYKLVASGPMVDAPYVLWIGYIAIALLWVGFYLTRRERREPIRRSFQTYPNVVLSAASVVSLIVGAISTPGTLTWLGWIAMAATGLLAATTLWNDRAARKVFAPFVWTMGFALAVVHSFDREKESWWLLVLALVSAAWGFVFAKRSVFARWAKQVGGVRLANLERAWQLRLPALQLLGAVVAVLACIGLLRWSDVRLSRYIAAIVPLIFGAGMIPLACQPEKNFFRQAFANLKRARLRKTNGMLAFDPVVRANRSDLLFVLPAIVISLLTLGFVFLSMADLPTQVMYAGSTRLLSRVTIALGLLVFLYGLWIPQRLDATSRWLLVVRNGTVGTTLIAVCAFTALLLAQGSLFQPGVGSGLALGLAMAVTVVVVAMILGLLAIAVLPKHDPLSLSLEGRQGYVYAAQGVLALLGVHVYLSMPWLFEFGILKYWPYLAMILAFGGVGVAHLLKKRELQVLAQPIFNTGVLIPIVTAAGFWAVDSRADAALVMLLAGLLYLAITIVDQSVWSAVAAIVFGNLALWLFYDKFPGLAFFTHPQLWLIPPALSVLVAAQVNKHRLSEGQLAMLRYVSLVAIYLSSTSEIFISGLGQRLLPPMILAVLAVLGIFAGMMFQVRAFLYLGSVFLLLAMITMVAHAQQRLDHVWPWWAFGLIMGTAILVMFGLFEKRRSDMQAIVGQLKEWES